MKAAYFTKIASLIAYLVLSAASIWGVAESFHMTLSGRLPKPIGYLIGFALIALGSLSLYLIRRSMQQGYIDNRRSSIVLGIAFFALSAVALAVANSHNLFYLMVAPDIRQQDAIRSKEALVDISTATPMELLNANQRAVSRVNQLIEQLKKEIRNDFNPGMGVASMGVLRLLSEAIGESINPLSGKPTSGPELERYAQRMGDLIASIANEKFKLFSNAAAAFQKKYENVDAKSIVADLELAAAGGPTLEDSAKMTLMLRRAKAATESLVDTAERLFSDPTIKKYGASMKKQTAPQMISEQITYAPYVIGSFLTSTLQAPLAGKYIWAFAIGLIFDVGAFMFWFFGVLRRSDD